jgi:glycosyltransferase involved in cell wall biosynthesis
MRILFCNKYSFPFSGTEVYLFELMDLLRAQNHEVELFSMADPRATHWRYQDDFVPHLDFNSEGRFCPRMKLAAHAIYSSDARQRLQRVIADFRPDLVHVRNIYHHLSPSILWEVRAQNIPVLYHLNDFKVICPSYNLVAHGSACDRCHHGHFWHAMANRCYRDSAAATAVLTAEAYVHKWLRTYQRCVTRWLAPSRFVRHKLINNGWPADRIDVLYHFQKLTPFTPAPPREDAPVLYFGRLSPEKGLRDLLRAMQRLPRVRLQIAGDGPQKSELYELTQRLGLANVEFAGHQQGKQLDQLIASSGFTVFPSHAYETLGKTILESYAHSRAVIATDLGSRRELIMEGKTGLLYQPGNWQQLAQEIEFLYFQPGLARNMGMTGRELVRRRHSPEAHYDALLKIYEELAYSHQLHRATPASPKLRIAFIGARGVGSKYSGIETYYEEVGRRLAGKDHQVTAYCRPYFTPAGEAYQGIRIQRLPTIRTKHLDTLVHTALSTMHAMAQPYDIIHYHALGPSLFSFLPRLCGMKTVVTIQGLDWQRKKWGRFASTVLRLGEYSAIKFPDATMVVSRTLQDYFRSHYGVIPTLIPNGTHLRGRTPIQCLNNWGLDPENYILFLGRFSPEKNCHLLIEAYQQLTGDTKLVLAGGSSYSDPYVDALKKFESDRIRLLNWISGDALDELLTHAMIFVLPSDIEGLSLALLDAMAAGVCVVTSDVTENREVVEGAGFTFRRGDPADLARVLRNLIEHPDLRKQAAQAARERALQLYLWPHIVDQIEAEYFRVLGRISEHDSESLQETPASKTHRAA